MLSWEPTDFIKIIYMYDDDFLSSADGSVYLTEIS